MVRIPWSDWNRARLAAASARPPVRAKGTYSAVTWTTVTGSRLAVTRADWGSCALRAARRSTILTRGRIVGERILPNDRHIIPLGVLLHHSPAGEAGHPDSKRVPHSIDESGRNALLIPIVVEGNQVLFQQSVEVL